jgi:cell division protein ZapA
MKERYTIQICGMELNLLSEESEEYVLALAKKIDQQIGSMTGGHKHTSKTEAALVCALGYLDGKIKTQAELDELRDQLEDLQRENLRLNKALEDAKRNGN